MDLAYDDNLVARLLLTVITIGYGGITVLADFNKTHATNPLWRPHARFHVVWQITSYVGLGALALALVWTPGPFYLERLYLAGALGAIVYGAFFVALLTMKLYGGRTHDENGYQPFVLPLGRPVLMDVNVSAFTIFTLVLAAAMLSIARPAIGGWLVPPI
jgi:hypothetical protein